VRVLFVYASPKDEDAVRVAGELRAIRQAIELGVRKETVEIDDLPAATIDDLRRALLQRDYEVLHFAGHSDSTAILLENEDGQSAEVDLMHLAALVKRYPSIRCVVLNACDSLATFSKPIAALTLFPISGRFRTGLS
jgi:CHAT domain-containing protein